MQEAVYVRHALKGQERSQPVAIVSVDTGALPTAKRQAPDPPALSDRVAAGWSMPVISRDPLPSLSQAQTQLI